MSGKANEIDTELDPHSLFEAELERIPTRMRKFLVRKSTPHSKKRGRISGVPTGGPSTSLQKLSLGIGQMAN
jgi:hypothetical protein